MYRETAPGAALAPYVECFWTRDDDLAARAGGEYRVLPDGCVDLIFSRGAGYAVGTMTRALTVSRAEGAAMVGVRFHPGGAAALLGCDAGALTDLRVPLRDVTRSLPEQLEGRIADAGSPADRVRALAQALEPRLRAARPVEPLVAAASRLLRARDGRVRIETLGDELGVTRQHLARAFARHVGVSPKTFARVARLQAVVRRAGAEPEPRWGRLAHEMGYADQAHLCSEFREMVGLSPARWAALR